MLSLTVEIMRSLAIMALSPGFADQILARLPYRNLTRPVYPLDRDVEWKP
jgi:microcystin degradation protein MlrC